MTDFTIPGPPVGKGRPRFFKRGNHVGTFTPEKTASYENLVKMAAREVFRGPLIEGPLQMRIRAFFPIPKSMPKAKRQMAEDEALHVTKKPDGDNIGKIVCDALNGIIYHDDAQVSDLMVSKRYSSEPRVEVSILTSHAKD